MTQRPIDNDWKQYFEDFYEGLGTTYERFILHRYFEKITGTYFIENVLEAPSFGMTGISGINSMWWSHHGIRVTIVDDNTERIDQIGKIWSAVGLHVDLVNQNSNYALLPFPDKCFDLSWNFAALHSVSDFLKFFTELIRITRKVIFICMPNEHNICRLIRSGVCGSGFSKEYSKRLRTLPSIIADLGWHIGEQGYLDVPPWPDIAMKKEDFLRKLGLYWSAKTLEDTKENRYPVLDYFNGKDPALEKRILKWSFLENSPRIFKKFWAHHQYFIFISR
jgi:SAM-dependent methyltransferase